jgi:hypothetical protein
MPSLVIAPTSAADVQHLTQTTEGQSHAALGEIKHLPPSDANTCIMVCCACAVPFLPVFFPFVWRLMLNISLKPLKASLVLCLVK